MTGSAYSPGYLLLGLLIVSQACGGSDAGAQRVKSCTSDDTCRPLGSRCIGSVDGGLGECGQQCSSDICLEIDSRQQCTSKTYGKCAPVSCTADIPCQDPERVCDEFVQPGGRCVPRSGTCQDLAECPVFSPTLLDERYCDATLGLCRLSPLALSSSTFWPDAAPISVDRPQPGETFASTEEVRFAWQRTNTSALIVVLRDLPDGYDFTQIAQDSIWGAARGIDAPTEISWADGVRVSGGVWLGSPDPPPSSTMYLLVLGVKDGQTESASNFIPFRVGSPWPQPSDSCADEDSIPGDCENLALPMRCLGGTCLQLCLSSADCPSPLVCSDPVMGTRVCVQ